MIYMLIMQFIPHLNTGGAEVMMTTLAKEIKRHNCQVIVVTFFSDSVFLKKKLEDENIKIINLNKKNGFDISLFKKIKKLVREYKPDILHTHLSTFFYVYLATLFMKIKIVHTVHSIATKEHKKIQKLICRSWYKSKRVRLVAISPVVKETLISCYKIKEHNIPIIYNGIEFLNDIADKDYSIKSDEITLVHIGSLIPVKNHVTIINSIAKLINDGHCIKLYLLGDGTSRKDIELLVEQKGISNNVNFTGTVSNVHEYLNLADIFIFPSIYEGMPMSLIEAMSHGLPIVASNVGGIPDMITDKESGLLINPNENELCEKIIELVNDQSLRERLGKKAKEKSNEFSSENMFESYLKEYKKYDD